MTASPYLTEMLAECRELVKQEPGECPTLRAAWLALTWEDRPGAEDRLRQSELDWRNREARKHAGRVAHARPARTGGGRRVAIPAALRRFIRATHPWCYYCGGLGVHIDHIWPWARGGSNDRTNLANACRRCNDEKLDHTVEEWRELRLGRGDPWPPPPYWPPEVFERFERHQAALRATQG